MADKKELKDEQLEQVSGGGYIQLIDFNNLLPSESEPPVCSYGKTQACTECTTINGGTLCSELYIKFGDVYECGKGKGGFEMKSPII